MRYQNLDGPRANWDALTFLIVPGCIRGNSRIGARVVYCRIGINRAVSESVGAGGLESRLAVVERRVGAIPSEVKGIGETAVVVVGRTFYDGEVAALPEFFRVGDAGGANLVV